MEQEAKRNVKNWAGNSLKGLEKPIIPANSWLQRHLENKPTFALVRRFV